MKNTKDTGFTLLELLIAVTIFSIIAIIVYLAIDPKKRFTDSRNTQRIRAVNSILDAVSLSMLDTKGILPTGVDTNLRMLGTATTGCDVPCGLSGSSTGTSTMVDSSQTTFSQGTYADTQWDSGNSTVDLTATGRTNGSGTFTSRIYDTFSPVTLSTIAWTPGQPYGKELPNNALSESGYTAGNANMTGNVLLLHMNEASGTLADSSGNNNSATKTGNPTYGTTGKYNTAVTFTGSDYLTINDSTTLNPPTAITLEAWVKWNITPGSGVQWASIAGKGDNNGYLLQHSQYNTMFEFALQASPSRVYVQSTTAPVMGNWYHLTGTYDGTTIKLYVNGVLEKSAALTGAIHSTTSPFFVSRSNGGRPFNGVIDEVAMYNRALSATEIAEHYTRGSVQLKHQIRTCSDAACTTGGLFRGPDGTTGTYYTDPNGTLTPPSMSVTGVLQNQYIQYRSYFTTTATTQTPTLKDIALTYLTSGTGENTAASCLDLSTPLQKYLEKIPTDPSVGSSAKTYYAVRGSDNGNVEVISCHPEENVEIKVAR